MRSLSVIITLLLSFNLIGQQTASNKEEALELNAVGDQFFNSDPQKALRYYQKANDWFQDNPLCIEGIRNMQWLASSYSAIGQCDSAHVYFDKAFSDALIINEFKLAIDLRAAYVMRCLIKYGGDMKEELNVALQIKEKSKYVSDNKVKIAANRLLVDLYWDTEGTEEEMLDLAIENDEMAPATGDTVLLLQSRFDLSYAYGRIGKHQLAIDTYKKVVELQQAIDDPFISASYNNIANQFYDLKMVDSALFYFTLGEEFSVIQGRKEGIAASKLYKGGIYSDLGQFEKSRDLCLAALEIFRETGILRRQDLCAKCLEDSYLGLGEKDKAYEYRVLFDQLQDSLNSRNDKAEFQQLQTEFSHQVSSMRDSLDFAHSNALKESKIQQQQTRSYFLYAGIAVVALFAFFILNRFRITRRQKKIIEAQKQEVEDAHEQLTEKNQEILDSIVYAKRIQTAMLPSMKHLKEKLPNSFVLYLPKDIVAGDFYWMDEKDDQVLIAAADCTGHGVPGAMVSVVCHHGLDRSVREHQLSKPSDILNKTREIVVNEFEKSEEEVKDGMDIALLSLTRHEESCQLQFAGAHNPLWIIRNNSTEIEEIQADKQPIGKFLNPTPYTNHEVMLAKGDRIFIFTDGYADQFGGPKGKKLKAANFKKLLLESANQAISEQGQFLEKCILEWKGSLEQLDDICVIGIEI